MESKLRSLQHAFETPLAASKQANAAAANSSDDGSVTAAYQTPQRSAWTPNVDVNTLQRAIDESTDVLTLGSAKFLKKYGRRSIAATPLSSKALLDEGMQATVGLFLSKKALEEKGPEEDVLCTVEVMGMHEGSFAASLEIIKPGDLLVAIDCVHTYNRSVDECYALLTGQEGTTCLGSFYRQSKGMYFEVPMLRLRTSLGGATPLHSRTALFGDKAGSAETAKMLDRLKLNGLRIAEMSAVHFGRGADPVLLYSLLQEQEQQVPHQPFSVPPSAVKSTPMARTASASPASQALSPQQHANEVLAARLEAAEQRRQEDLLQSEKFAAERDRELAAAAAAEPEQAPHIIEMLLSQLRVALTLLEQTKMSSPSKQPAASPSILDRITADERGRGETDLQKEVRELKIKVKSLTDAYARQQASTRELDAELSQARALIGDNTDHFEQGRRTVTEHRLRAEDQDKTIQELRDELLRMREAHERAVEKVSTLTNTTLDQTAEIYRLNELVVQLGQHHLDKPGATPMQVQQELHKSSFWVPVV